MAVTVCSCSPVMTEHLPAPLSRAPSGTTDGLYAGFARVDITPPPGVSLAGNGPEAQIADGYRNRLYARTVVLHGQNGIFSGLVVVDLPLMSEYLHREIAVRLSEKNLPIAADNLLISATHTHSGPGNFFGASQYNDLGGKLEGFDPVMFEFLASRISFSIEEALKKMEPAKAGWGEMKIGGVTKNRSIEAFEQNPEAEHILAGITSVKEKRWAAIDSTFLMLRIDTCNEARDICKPKGAYSVFAIHGTGYPAASSLLDADVFAKVQRGLERHIEQLNPSLGHSFYSKAFHLFANGAEGDASPAHLEGTRCEDHLAFRHNGAGYTPFSIGVREEWSTEDKKKEECLRIAKKSVDNVGERLSEHAIQLFDKIGDRDILNEKLAIRYATRTLVLPGLQGDGAVLCDTPSSGLSNLAGSTEDARTRLEGWRLVGVFPLGFEEGGRAVDKMNKGCDGAKRKVLGPLQGAIVTPYSFPHFAQITALELGDAVLFFLPFEVTTMAGMRLKNEVLASIRKPPLFTSVVSITNGYLQYLTTKEEYALQHYEGGSNLYGPETERVIRYQVGVLVQSLQEDHPVQQVDSMFVKLGKQKIHFPASQTGPPYNELKRGFVDIDCTRHEIAVEWLDAYPGRFIPAEGQVLQLEMERNNTWEKVAWDDESDIVVRALKKQGDKGFLWRMEWKPKEVEKGIYRMVLLERQNNSGVLTRIEGSLENNGVIKCSF